MNKFIHEPYEFEEIEQVTPTDGGGRYYLIPSGEKYYSVTTILGRRPKPYLDQWKNRIGEEAANKIKNQAASRGTNLHKLLEDYFNGEYETKKYMPRAIDMFNSIKPKLDSNVKIVNNQEFPLYSHKLKTAGKCDLLADWNGIKSIVDFKSSSKPKKLEWIDDYFLQTCCYSMMTFERIGLIVPQLVIIVSVEDSVIPQIFIEKTSNWIKRTMDVFINKEMKETG